MKTITIIWAGAAGLMIAATILESTGEGEDIHIRLFEKNTSPGKKVIISGGGRCNVTTGITDRKELLARYTRWAEFIKTAMGKFSPKKCREWFESHGVPLKCESDNRVFPISDDGHDIVEVFSDVFAKYRDSISLHYSEWASSVRKVKETYSITTPKWVYDSDILVITTGGNAYSHTGSSWDGYAFARALGHTVTPLGPSLSSFLTSDNWLHILSGLAFEEASLGFTLGDSLIKQSLSWPLLLTHFGISWPLTFRVSSHLAFEMITPSLPKYISFSPLADMDFASWEVFLKESFQKYPKKLLSSILSEKLSRRFVDAFIQQYFASIKETFVGSISRADREDISRLLGEGIPLTLIERRPGDEFVTAWGVSTDELDPESMESKTSKNLYFAGEILNVDGVTGGFSLQICWTSGYVAGKDIAQKLAKIEKSI